MTSDQDKAFSYRGSNYEVSGGPMTSDQNKAPDLSRYSSYADVVKATKARLDNAMQGWRSTGFSVRIANAYGPDTVLITWEQVADYLNSAALQRPDREAALVEALRHAIDRFGAIGRMSAWTDSDLNDAGDEAREAEAKLKALISPPGLSEGG